MKVTVCIPVYKAATYIEQCARSLFEQTYADMEYVFVDDCSPDDSMAIVERVLKDYPNRASQVKLLRHEKNRGLIDARQTAIKAATGDVIAHCDPDDWLEADLCEKILACFADETVDMVYFPFRCEYPDGRSVVRDMPDCHGSVRVFFDFAERVAGFHNMCNKVFRRALATAADIECPTGIGTGEDTCFVSQALVKCRKIVYLPQAGYHYRQHPVSMSRTRQARAVLNDLTTVYEVVMRKVSTDLSQALRRQLTECILYFGVRSGTWRRHNLQEWRTKHAAVGGRYDFAWLNADGRRYMRLAAVSLGLARLYDRLRPGRIGCL